MKGRRPWHKRYHEDALNGYIGLTLEERGRLFDLSRPHLLRGAPLRSETAAETTMARRLAVGAALGCAPRRSVL